MSIQGNLIIKIVNLKNFKFKNTGKRHGVRVALSVERPNPDRRLVSLNPVWGSMLLKKKKRRRRRRGRRGRGRRRRRRRRRKYWQVKIAHSLLKVKSINTVQCLYVCGPSLLQRTYVNLPYFKRGYKHIELCILFLFHLT